VLNRVADKWTALLIAILAEGPIGYAELRRSAAGVSHKMLAQTLRNLERDGLVERTVVDSRPVSVSYSLTPFGETIVPPLAALRTWAQTYGPELVAHQVAYDQRAT
jgi:DNA-binding HxlR family transcriptional regulator